MKPKIVLNVEYLKYLNTTQSQPQCERSLYFLLVLLKEMRLSTVHIKDHVKSDQNNLKSN